MRINIISIYKNARRTYAELKVDNEKYKNSREENSIIDYLESDEIEIFFKAFSMKDYFNKTIINKYNLKHIELVKTEWVKRKIGAALDIVVI